MSSIPLSYPDAEGFEFFSADLVGFWSDGVVAGFEASLLSVVDHVVGAFVVQNGQNEDGNGQNAAQRHPRHVDDVPKTEHLRRSKEI